MFSNLLFLSFYIRDLCYSFIYMLVINHGAITHCTSPIKIPNNGYMHSSRLPSSSSVQPTLAPNLVDKPLNSATFITNNTNNTTSTDVDRKRLPPKMYWGTTPSRNWQYEIEVPSTLDTTIQHLDSSLSPEHLCVRIRSRYNKSSSPLASCLIGCRLVQKESGIKGFIYTHIHTHNFMRDPFMDALFPFFSLLHGLSDSYTL